MNMAASIYNQIRICTTLTPTEHTHSHSHLHSQFRALFALILLRFLCWFCFYYNPMLNTPECEYEYSLYACFAIVIVWGPHEIQQKSENRKHKMRLDRQKKQSKSGQRQFQTANKNFIIYLRTHKTINIMSIYGYFV